MNALVTQPLSKTVDLIRRGELSPVAYARTCLEQLDRLNPVLNAVVTVNERLLEEAAVLEKRIARGEDPGPLAGLTVGIKDVTPVAGLRTTYGSPLYRDHIPDRDALVVARFRAAGALILGKTNTPEFATGGNTFNDVFGRTRNPWNPALSAGGSTGGGAAALAAGMIAIAEGTDLGGSLRIPASFCGVVGLRPSPGFVPTYPSDYLWDTMQVSGCMARTAEDLALALEAVNGPDAYTPVVQPSPPLSLVQQVRQARPEGLRLAFVRYVANIGIDSDVEATVRASLDRLAAAGVRVEEISLDLSDGWDAFMALRGLWMVVQQFNRLEHLEAFGENLKFNVKAGLKISTLDLAAAEHKRAEIRHRVLEVLKRFDLIATPSMAVPPFPVEENYPRTIGGREMKTYVDWIAPTFILSLTGLPVASVPAGLDSRNLPVGLQLVAPPFGEGLALKGAAVVQKTIPIGLPPEENILAFSRS